MSSFYLTTAIDYTNGKPHIGHAYEKVLADVIHRYRKLAGDASYFLTGVDQYGQKVQQSAEKEDIHPGTHVRKLTKGFTTAWEKLELSYDGFAQTTDPRHKAVVQSILHTLFDNGQIYKKQYRGYYSVRQEQFITEKERDNDGNFGPEWGEVEERDEENYYFKLSDHITWLRGFIESHESFIIPQFRRADVLNAIERNPDTDLCISRPKERLHWGIELPFDENFVTYVWFDALINYISFAGYLKDQQPADIGAEQLPDFDRLWPANLHIIGKDILVPAHAIYWPCMLHAMGFSDEQMPTLLVHGWWNIKSAAGSEKMSKSLGNVIDPVELAENYGADCVRYYLVRDIHTGRDANFDPERLVLLFNTELANNLGNLCNRALNMSKRFMESTIQDRGYDDALSKTLRESTSAATASYREHMEDYAVSHAIEAVIKLITQANQYTDQQEPWALAKDEEQKNKLATVLRHLCEVVAHVSVLLRPIVPAACARIQSQLKRPELGTMLLDDLAWGLLPTGHQTGKPKPVFPRIQ